MSESGRLPKIAVSSAPPGPLARRNPFFNMANGMSVADNAELHSMKAPLRPRLRTPPRTALRTEQTYKSPLAGFRVDTICTPASTSMFTPLKIQR
ncbi:hypothetical protein [Caballeronia sp. S22]|uniref:hypothetical protein n=1 Tax=Caballeronia sp. S22 TaxID=3137182 RepID=UPI003530EAC3